jgi:polyhydroxyalkanoate synthesis regulator phasin|tara:strand:- start:554 stop:808 length:255 start_codon:yes stop_codon:yes gene_type:complete
MSRIPESYYFYKDQLRRAKEEKAKLQKEYESKINGLNDEISFLKEQIQAQHSMIEQSIDYVMKLEKQIKTFDLELSTDKDENLE